MYSLIFLVRMAKWFYQESVLVRQYMTGTEPGVYTIKVKNTDGQLSNGVDLTITASAPQITSISPTQSVAGTFDLTINGNNFDTGAIDQIYWKADGHYVGQGTVLSRTSTRIVVRQYMTGTEPGVYTIKVKNTDGQLSNGVDLTITAPAPQITSISPTQSVAGTFDLTINGNNFDTGAIDQIYWKADGHYVGQGTVLSRTSTRIVVRQYMTGTEPGVYTIKVKNTDGQLSNGMDLTITAPVPQITSISPTQSVAGTFDLTINGNNFDTGAIDQIYWKADGHYVGQGTVLSRTSTKIVVRQYMAGTELGVYTVKVKNSDGKLSNGVDLTITAYSIAVTTSPPGLSPQPSGGGIYSSGETVTVSAQPVTGYTFQKWTENGNQVSTIASYSFTVTENRNLVAIYTQNLMIPLAGDLNGDGIITALNNQEVGTFDTGTNEFTFGGKTVVFGMLNDLPVIGDWDYDGKDEIGVFRPDEDGNSMFYLVTRDWAILQPDQNVGNADYDISFGYYPNNIPITGDWDGDGDDDIGGFNPGNNNFYLYSLNLGVSSATSYQDVPFGISGDKPIIGDWDGDGDDDVGVYRKFDPDYNNNLVYYFDLDLSGDQTELTAIPLGNNEDFPVIGDWDHDGDDDIGLYRSGTFLIDPNFNVPHDIVYLNNGIIKVGVDMQWGGAISVIMHNGMNLLDNHDTGRLGQVAFYDDSSAWNPVQGGDKANQGSPVIDHYAQTNVIYTKTQPRDWITGGLTDTYVEQWVSLDGQSVKVQYKLTHFGTDTHTFHDQELPCAYINSRLYRLITYTNSQPWTNDAINEFSIPQTDPGTPNTEFYPTEYWASFVNDLDFGLTLYSPDHTPKWAAHRFTIDTKPNYLTTIDQFSIGPGAVEEATEYFIVGNYPDARDIVYSFINIEDRSLLQVEGQPEVYWFQNDRLYWVTDWDVISQMSGVPGWDSVNTLPASEFEPADYEQGPSFITTGAESDGLLIREQGHFEVYRIENGFRRHITHSDVMDLYGYSMNNVIDVSEQVMNMFTLGNPIGIEVDLSFSKKTDSGEIPDITEFTTGDTIKFYTQTTVSESYTVDTYVKLTEPSGRTWYVYYDSPIFQPTDPLSFSDTEIRLYPDHWDAVSTNWNWDEYIFSNDEEGIYSWEFYYKDIASGKVFGWDKKSYVFVKKTDLNIQLTYKNTINLGDSVDINAKIFSFSTPVTANINIKVDDIAVANADAHDYTYTFTPDRVGSYLFEITATNGNLIGRKVGKVEVIGDLSKVLLLNDDTKNLAYREIDQTVYIPASKSIDFGKTVGIDIASGLIMKVLAPLSQLSGAFISETYRPNLDYLADRLGYFYQEVFSRVLKETVREAIEAGFNNVEEHAIFYLKDEFKTQFKTDAEIDKINAKSSDFDGYIRENQGMFLGNFDETNRLFIVYSEPISQVVETHSIASFSINIPYIGSYTLNSWTMQDEANFYELSKKAKGVIKFAALIFAIIIAAGTLIVAAGATVSSLGTLLPIIAGATWKILAFAKSVTLIGNGTLALAVILLVISISLVAPQVTEQHSYSIEAIKEAVNGMSASTISLQVEDTKILSATKIKSTGHTIVLTPDGKIVRILRGDGDYTPRTVGVHSAYAFLHTPQKLFNEVSSTTFNVSKPNITMNISKEVIGMNTLITTSVYNNENATISNLTLILSIENSTGSMFYADAKMFDLGAMEHKNLNFTVTFNESDVYTASASLTIMSLFPLQDEKFPIVVENATAEDVAILKVEHKDIYSPFEDITINLTLDSFSDMEYELNISEFNYSVPLNSSIKEVTITIPKLQPEEYTILIKAIKNNSILDSEAVRFTVKAIDVAILTFNTTRILYNTSADIAIDLNFKNLSGIFIDADMEVKVLHPNGTLQIVNTTKSGDAYEFRFRPPTNGTYVLESIGNKEGYRIKNETLTTIVGEMSKMSMKVNVSNITVISTFANGISTESNVTIYYENETKSEFASSGKAIFNVSNHFIVIADRMFYEPAYFEYFSDEDAPTSVTNLTAVVGVSWLNWTWTNPSDPDFNHTELHLNSTFLTNIPAPQNYYNITGLLPDTLYELSTRTVDTSGNINLTWVNDTASTLPASGTTLNLYTGWNLISLPLMPDDSNIKSVLSPISGNYSIVWAYNASNSADHWKKYDPATPFGNDLITMEPGNGYWIMMTSDDTLNIGGTMPEPTDIELWGGWNLIGYNSLNPQTITDALSSINGNYSIIWAYNASDSTDHWKKYDPNAPFGNDLANMEPGKGYWIMMTTDDILEI